MKGMSRTRMMVGMGFSALLAITPTAFASGDGHGGHGEAAKGMSLEETIKAVVEGNDQFKDHNDHGSFEAYQKGQTPSLTVISCADSRVHTPLFGMDPHNHIFSIRNIGNQIRNAQGSVDYGVNHLPTKVLMVMGHSGCGAVKAAMGDYSSESAGIKAELDPLKPVIATDGGAGPFDLRWAMNVEKNVDYQVGYACKLYGDKVKAGELTVVGAVYDFTDTYGKGRGTLVITNINGETEPAKLMGHPVLEGLGRGTVVSHVGGMAPTVAWPE